VTAKLLRQINTSPHRVILESSLKVIGQYLKVLGRKPPKCFISYAWYEKGNDKNNKLQIWLSSFKEDLGLLGIETFFDLYDMSTDLKDKMKQNIAKSDYVFVIATPRLKERVDLQPLSNARFEYELIFEYEKQIIPLILESSSNESFPTITPANYKKGNNSLSSFLYYNFVVDEKSPNAKKEKEILYIKNLFLMYNPKGIIPTLFEIPYTENVYESLVEKLFSDISSVN